METILSVRSDDETARTDPEIASCRAENLACLGVQSVLELCVGPSLKALHRAYSKYGLEVYGNDIDPRWQRYWPSGKWIVGDALNISWGSVDSVVFAPPLSRGCTGKRDDSLPISLVNPSYVQFLKEWAARGPKIAVMVLPARSLATAQDRAEYHGLLKLAQHFAHASPVAMTAGKRKIRKYIDVYLEKD